MNAYRFLSNEWLELVIKYSDDLELIDNFYEIIKRKYNSSNKHYHNLDHISLMLSEVKKLESRINDYDTLCFAIWFHDIIYNPLKSDNEERSAEYAEEFLDKIKYEKKRIHKVQELILRTKDHTIQNGNDNYDGNLFLDLDLLILGMEREQYIKYAICIRKEYNFFSDDIYNKERRKILHQYLNSQYIYKTKKFRDLYEKQARYNIKFEIDNILSNK
ncbi:MAG: hypothetical protein ACFFG0_33635 [Candidatus Thorarchaeota archaeon]